MGTIVDREGLKQQPKRQPLGKIQKGNPRQFGTGWDRTWGEI